MVHPRIVTGGIVLVFCLLNVPSAVAQITGIAGVVRDTSGAVLPGVTIEASSPALIEKVRSGVSDGQGLYRIVDLRPGIYTVTFTLPGFSTVKRDGIELSGSFTATVNAELSVGAVEETVTVSAESPTVDVHNVVQQQVISADVRELLPAARSLQNFGQAIPGILGATQGTQRPSGQDVGGTTSDRGSLMIHGSRFGDFSAELDGMLVHNSSGTGGSQTHTFNPAESQEYVYELSAVSAATMSGGVRVNVIPKEGGNRFTGSFFGTYANEHFVSNNLTTDLIQRGLQTPNKVKKVWDYNVAAGGPLKRDRLWFFASYRNWGQHEQVAGMFRMIDPFAFTFNPRLGAAGNADVSRPAIYQQWHKMYSLRLTWQAHAKHKFSVYGAQEPREQDGQNLSGTRSYEASNIQRVDPQYFIHTSWKSPLASRVLLEAAYAHPHTFAPSDPTISNLEPDVISVTDIGTGLTFRSAPFYNYFISSTPSAKAAVSYVTGGHAAKVGVDLIWGGVGRQNREHRVNQGMTYTLQNGVPRSITVSVAPRSQLERFRSVGLYAQDQWTLRRLTINAGIRFDYHQEWVPLQESGPGPFVAFQTWPEVKNVPNWKDLSPRLGVAYDLFGSGKTAVKGTVNRYVVRDFTSFAAGQNPMLFNATATRQWSDLNQDLIPQNAELGPLSNSRFGTTATTTRTDDVVREGWGVRLYNWELSASIQHELAPRVSLNVAYFRRWYGNFIVTDNLALTPADYDEYCIVAPTDSRLPGGGEQNCGLYDLNPTKFSVTPNNLRTDASKYGSTKETYDGIDVNVNVRLSRRVMLAGGVSSGTSNLTQATITNSMETCFVVDSPEALRFCDANVPWQTGLKMMGTVGLPWGIDGGATFQSNPGPQILANYAVTSSQVKFINPGRTSLSGGSVTIPLIKPFSMFGDRLYQLDLRFSKSLLYRGVRTRINVDIANALNSSAVLVLNNAFGVNWQRPSYIHPGRIVKPSVTIEF